MSWKLVVAEVQPTEHPAFNEFVATIEALRSPDGCPWDKEQTHKSISGNMVEEAYEAVDAIEADDVAHMREELGDVLLQVVLQSQIAADAGEFTIDDVCRDVNAKIVRRHPHVFGDVVAGDANEVLDVWDQIKMAEKESADAAADAPQGLLDGVPKSFPALKQAQKISRKAASAGFSGKRWTTCGPRWTRRSPSLRPPTPPRRSPRTARWMPPPIRVRCSGGAGDGRRAVQPGECGP